MAHISKRSLRCVQSPRAAVWHRLVSWKGHVLAALSAAANSPAAGHQTEGFIQAPCITDETNSRPGVMGWLWNGCGLGVDHWTF